MTKFWIHVIFLLTTASAKSIQNGEAFPDALYPSTLSRGQLRSKCPDQFSTMDICITKYEDCFETLRSIKDCNNEFCSCTRKPELDETISRECSILDDACTAVHQRGIAFQRQIKEKKKKLSIKKINKNLKPILDAHERMVSDCEIQSEMKREEMRIMDQLNTTNPLITSVLPFFAIVYVEPFISMTNKCRIAIDGYENKLEKVDAETVQSLQIPYQIWFIGTEFGSIAKVVSRFLFEESCEKASWEFNHHSVVWVNCYDQQKNQKKCDEKYIQKNKDVLKTMNTNKWKCSMLIDMIQSLQSLRADEFYKEATVYDSIPFKFDNTGKFTQSFEEFKNGSMTQRNTRTVIADLEASEKSSMALRQSFDIVSHRCGNSRNVLSSCGIRYEYCIHKIKNDCQEQLSMCLSGIKGVNESCHNAIEEISNRLYPSTDTTTDSVSSASSIPIGRFEDSTSTLESNIYSWTVALILIILIVALAVIILLIFPKRSSGNNKELDADTTNDTKPETMELIDRTSVSSSEETIRTDSGIDITENHSVNDETGVPDNNGNTHVIELEQLNNERSQENREIKYDEYPSDVRVIPSEI